MYWLIFLILSFLCTILNPYVGLFGLLFILEFEVFWFLDENIQRASKFTASYVEKSESKYSELFKKSGKGVLNLWCILAVLFFGFMTVLSLVVWLFASGSLFGTAREMTPFVIFGEENKMLYARILLIVGMIFHFITMLLVFTRRSEWNVKCDCFLLTKIIYKGIIYHEILRLLTIKKRFKDIHIKPIAYKN